MIPHRDTILPSFSLILLVLMPFFYSIPWGLLKSGRLKPTACAFPVTGGGSELLHSKPPCRPPPVSPHKNRGDEKPSDKKTELDTRHPKLTLRSTYKGELNTRIQRMNNSPPSATSPRTAHPVLHIGRVYTMIRLVPRIAMGAEKRETKYTTRCGVEKRGWTLVSSTR